MPINPLPLGAQTYQLLLSQILAGKRAAGEKISEESISGEFGISRTPAREALMRLAADGFIHRTARKGCRIRLINRQELADMFRCRSMLEALALRLGFERISAAAARNVLAVLEQAHAEQDAAASLKGDDLMHEMILTACPNRTLGDIIARLRQQCKATRALRAVATDVQAATNERLAVVRAILQGDKDAAERLLVAHVLQGACE